LSKAVIEFDKLARLFSVICVRASKVVVTNSTYRRDAAVTSLRQIEANRRNALKSTGPTTDAGKYRSRRNAVRHGV